MTHVGYNTQDDRDAVIDVHATFDIQSYSAISSTFQDTLHGSLN